MNREEVIDALTKTKELFTTMDWVKGTFAVDKNGMDVYLTDRSVCGLCLEGALDRVYFSVHEADLFSPRNDYLHCVHGSVRNAIYELYPKFDMLRLSVWNDRVAKNKDEVIKVLDKAIERVRAQNA